MSKNIVKEWPKIQKQLDKSLENGLVNLYMLLTDEAFLYKEYDNCNEFIEFLPKQKPNTNVLVHTLNVLSNIKDKLPEWDNFVMVCEKYFIETEGEEAAKQLLKVIM
jgi:hypothetical protein